MSKVILKRDYKAVATLFLSADNGIILQYVVY